MIKNAIEAYKKLANFMIEGNKRYIKVEIECIDKEVEGLIKRITIAKSITLHTPDGINAGTADYYQEFVLTNLNSN